MQFPKGDVRRLLTVAHAIATMERPTLSSLSAATGHHKQSISDDVTKLGVQLGVVIEKDEAVYRLVSWGPVIKGPAVAKFLKATQLE
jgi:hypothetical protein